MQITLNEAEIKKAIIAYVGNQGISITGQHVTVALIAGRAPNGMSASIDISNEEQAGKTVIEVEDKKTETQSGLVFNQAVADADATKVETPAAEKPLFGKD